MLTNEKILVTGPAGQVACPLARELVKHNQVYGLARFSNAADRTRLEAQGIICLAADLAADSLAAVPDDFTYVLHFAVSRSDDFDRDLAANAAGACRLMHRTRRAKAWLQCSSMRVYQYRGHAPLKETDALGDAIGHTLRHKPRNVTYSISKIVAEVMARFAARQWNIPTTIARLTVPYGNNGGWPARHLDALVAGQPIPVHLNRPSTYNPIHADDYIAHIPKLLGVAAVPATVVNWGGEAVSIEDWCTYMGQLLGTAPQFVYTDQALASMEVDLTRMHALIGPATVAWRDGFRRMMRARHPERALRG
jgi:UDP-glucuronate 4-epimerase